MPHQVRRRKLQQPRRHRREISSVSRRSPPLPPRTAARRAIPRMARMRLAFCTLATSSRLVCQWSPANVDEAVFGGLSFGSRRVSLSRGGLGNFRSNQCVGVSLQQILLLQHRWAFGLKRPGDTTGIILGSMPMYAGDSWQSCGTFKCSGDVSCENSAHCQSAAYASVSGS